jgi:hypothetical protein
MVPLPSEQGASPPPLIVAQAEPYSEGIAPSMVSGRCVTRRGEDSACGLGVWWSEGSYMATELALEDKCSPAITLQDSELEAAICAASASLPVLFQYSSYA